MSEGLADVRLHLIDSVDDAAEFMRWLGQPRKFLAFDVETEGLDWTRHKVRLIQVGDEREGWAMPWDLWGGVALEALAKYEGQLIGHNVIFDTNMLEAHCGVVLPRHRIDDTMIAAHVLDSTRPVALKSLCAHLIDPKAAAAQQVLEQMMTNNRWTWATVPIGLQEYWAYGALDTVITARLGHIVIPAVRAEAPKAYDLEMATTWVVQKMARRGCQVDIPYTREKLAAFEQYVDQAGTWIEATYGVSAGSDARVIERLQQDGIEFTKMTSSGSRFALDKEVLEGLAHHPLAATILQRRRLQKLASTYLENFISMSDEHGVLHPNFRVLGARTSRMSITEPALQTLPRKSEANAAAIVVRNCITAREDHTLVMADFRQIEARLLAHFSRDPGLIGAFKADDFFTAIAREIHGDPSITKSDERRQSAKNSVYALGYGAGAEKIAITSGQTLELVQEFLRNLELRYPGIKQFQRQVATVAKQRLESEGVAYIRSPLTNRKQIADPGKEYALVNFLIQMTAAEFFKAKNVELDAAGVSEYLILDVHDEIIADVPNDLVNEVSRTVNEIMTDTSTFDVDIESDITQAFRWGEAAK